MPALLISSGATVTLIVDRFTEERLIVGNRSTANTLTTKSILNGENGARKEHLQKNFKRTLDRVTVKRGVVYNGGQAK